MTNHRLVQILLLSHKSTVSGPPPPLDYLDEPITTAILLPQTSARSASPYAPWSSGSGWTSRRSSWNSLGRAPSLKRQKRQSGERRSLLSGDGGSSSEDGEGGQEGGGGLLEEDDTSLARTDSMSQSQRGPRHRRMESVETRSSMDLPPDSLLQVQRPPLP